MSSAGIVLLHVCDAKSIEVSSAWMSDSSSLPELVDQ